METYLSGFPDMFADRWSKITGLSRDLDRADLTAAKRKSLPRSGGNATPSKPIKPETEIENILDQFEPEGGWTD